MGDQPGLAAELLSVGQGCTLEAPLPSLAQLREHLLLGDPHVLIDGDGIVNTFHVSPWQLFEAVAGQARGCIRLCITGHHPWVGHHHAGGQIHLKAKDCHRERAYVNAVGKPSRPRATSPPGHKPTQLQAKRTQREPRVSEPILLPQGPNGLQCALASAHPPCPDRRAEADPCQPHIPKTKEPYLCVQTSRDGQ